MHELNKNDDPLADTILRGLGQSAMLSFLLDLFVLTHESACYPKCKFGGAKRKPFPSPSTDYRINDTPSIPL